MSNNNSSSMHSIASSSRRTEIPRNISVVNNPQGMRIKFVLVLFLIHGARAFTSKTGKDLKEEILPYIIGSGISDRLLQHLIYQLQLQLQIMEMKPGISNEEIAKG
ncbi:OLC1v1037004C1 [Oldenlandia corymbosa var. corymbosa]|uniref:OLC1v1037004C1 n=1 Tax=Oldenlandia corymbosa var. corymbosa TaxID=529605 RepID=A0AAV1CWQ1_OLDCO|nr:OLC1v1037004C1 [Oldenlandia corymbosa var. corymbosa]